MNNEIPNIKGLSKSWWLNLKEQECHNFRIKYSDFNIENIFYNEVVLKWWDNLPTWGNPSKEYFMGLYFVDDTVTQERIKEIYLNEHTKEQPQSVGSKRKAKVLREVDIDVSYELTKEREGEIDKLMKDNSGGGLESKVRNLFSPIKNYISASRNVLSNMEDGELVKIAREEGLRADQNIYAIISEVHNVSQPKVIEWEVVRKEYFSYVSECRLNGINYLDFFKWLEKFYSLVKK
jgi:hypothetical protein